MKYDSLALISGNLLTLYDDGISIIESIDILLELPLDNKYKKSLMSIKISIEEGNTLGVSFEKFPFLYPKFFSGALKIGEDTGVLSETLSNLNIFYNNLSNINKKLKTALRYPLLVLGFLIGLVFLFFIMIVPSMYETFQSMNKNIPSIIKKVYEIYKYLLSDKVYSISLIISLIIISILLFFLFKIRSKEKENRWLLKIKFIRQYYEYIFIMNLSIILNSGMQINKGIDLCMESMNIKCINNEMKKLKEKVSKGNSIENSLKDSRILSKYTLSMIALGGRGSNLHEVLIVSSKRLEEQLLDRLNKVVSAINPIAITIISLCIMVFIFLFILPMIDMLYSGAI